MPGSRALRGLQGKTWKEERKRERPKRCVHSELGIVWFIMRLCVIEGQAHAHQCPVRHVVLGRQVSLKHQPDAHRIAAIGGCVHGRAECVLKLKFVRFDWNDLARN